MCTVKANVLPKILVTLGALNWGLVGLFKFDLVPALFGKNSAGTRLIYILVGMAAIYLLIFPLEGLFQWPPSWPERLNPGAFRPLPSFNANRLLRSQIILNGAGS
jgi:hypothetical protein